jgi:hypothetical protein
VEIYFQRESAADVFISYFRSLLIFSVIVNNDACHICQRLSATHVDRLILNALISVHFAII